MTRGNCLSAQFYYYCPDSGIFVRKVFVVLYFINDFCRPNITVEFTNTVADKTDFNYFNLLFTFKRPKQTEPRRIFNYEKHLITKGFC